MVAPWSPEISKGINAEASFGGSHALKWINFNQNKVESQFGRTDFYNKGLDISHITLFASE